MDNSNVVVTINGLPVNAVREQAIDKISDFVSKDDVSLLIMGVLMEAHFGQTGYFADLVKFPVEIVNAAMERIGNDKREAEDIQLMNRECEAYIREKLLPAFGKESA